MPYVSEAQRRYFHANKAKLEAQGVSVDEWDAATKGKSLPEHKPGSAAHKKSVAFKRGTARAFPKTSKG